jgi:hypothetical protein
MALKSGWRTSAPAEFGSSKARVANISEFKPILELATDSFDLRIRGEPHLSCS